MLNFEALVVAPVDHVSTLLTDLWQFFVDTLPLNPAKWFYSSLRRQRCIVSDSEAMSEIFTTIPELGQRVRPPRSHRPANFGEIPEATLALPLERPPTMAMAGSLSPLDRHRSPSPRSDFLAIPEFGSPHQHSASSPTSLNVPGSWTGFGGTWDVRRRTSSAASSIFDLTAECEQLERALKHNDVSVVRKYLQLHHCRFPLDVHASFLDKSSCDSHSRRQSHVSQDVDILLRKSQTLIDSLERHRDSEATEEGPNIFSFLDKSSCDSHSRRQSHVSQDVDILLRKSQTLIDSLERHRDSEATEEGPNIFRCSLHIAMQHNSLDVVKVLLKYGVDPNEPQGQSVQAKSRRSSYQSSCGTDSSSPVACLGLGHHQAASTCEHSDQRLSPSPTLVIQAPDSPVISRLEDQPESRTLSSGHWRHRQHSADQSQHIPQPAPASSPTTTARCAAHAAKTHQNQLGQHHQQHPNQGPSPSPFSLSTLRAGSAAGTRGRTLEPPGRSPSSRRAASHVCQLPEIVETVIENGFQYGNHYTKDELFNLPCLYLAVVEGNPYFVQLLLRYGATPNIQDMCGCSPLHLACCPEFHNIEIIRILLRYGAKVTLTNAQADTPLTLWPSVLDEQKAVIRTALSQVPGFPPASKARSRTPSGPCHHSKESPPTLSPAPDALTHGASNRSGSVSRFFKRLSSDPKARPPREKKSLMREESSVFYSEAGRDRAYSSGSHKSLKSRHLSSYVQEDPDSDISFHIPSPIVAQYTQPPIVAQYTQPPIVAQYTQPPIVAQYTQPPIVAQYTQPPIVAQYTQPPIVAQYTQPPIVAQYTQPPIVAQYTQTTIVAQYTQPPIVVQYTQPPIVAQYTQPPIVAQYTQLSVVAQYTQPPIVAQYTQPPIVAQYTQPPIVAQYIQPPIVAQYTQHPIVAQYTQPLIVAPYTVSFCR
ncbi:hypothetical protein EGW08_012222 [Elysia chlorotica]|uniref:SOCS box domain-containing protein n=1 Tax=Elysia chlorotica TaxID=188477 RepID=A0A433TEM9_ELYCH|nr:hypothetical protein EGW08_012222 [Elysia chlorotica]